MALIDRASGVSVRYSELESFLRSRLDGHSFPVDRPFATSAASDFEHSTLLLGLLMQDVVIAPISNRLPEEEVLRRAKWIGAGCFWNGEKIHRLTSDQLPRSVEGGGTILFTSGSSGAPRAVWHGLEAHLESASGAASRIPLEVGCGWLLSLPIHHVSGFSILIRCLLAGATVVFPDKRLEFKKQIQDPAVTHLSVVAVQLRRLLAEGSSFEQFRSVLAGGGPIDLPLVEKATRSGVPLHLTYGMTETASQISTSDRLQVPVDAVSAGRILPGREVRISPNGEIQVRGGVLAHGVFTPRGFQALVDAGGWFSTGDAGFFDSHGNLVITGRLDRMFISGGENICPESIEAILATYPAIRRAVVVDVPDSEYGARPVAFLAGDWEANQLRSFLKSRVESFVVPDLLLPWPAGVDENDAKVDFKFFKRLAQRARV